MPIEAGLNSRFCSYLEAVTPVVAIPRVEMQVSQGSTCAVIQ